MSQALGTEWKLKKGRGFCYRMFSFKKECVRFSRCRTVGVNLSEVERGAWRFRLIRESLGVISVLEASSPSQETKMSAWWMFMILVGCRLSHASQSQSTCACNGKLYCNAYILAFSNSYAHSNIQEVGITKNTNTLLEVTVIWINTT